MKYPVRVYIKEHHGTDFFWKSLCLVYDAEAYGILERCLKPLELKVVEDDRAVGVQDVRTEANAQRERS